MSIELQIETIKDHRITRYKGCLIYQSGNKFLFNGLKYDTVKLAKDAVDIVLGLIQKPNSQS